MYNNPNYGNGYPQQMGQYGYQQPGYQQVPFQQSSFNNPYNNIPPPPQYQGGNKQQIVIQVNEQSNGTPCQYCVKKTPNIPRKSIGFATVCWSFCLTPCFLCWLPCCMDGCKDIQLVCFNCGNSKYIVKANCF